MNSQEMFHQEEQPPSEQLYNYDPREQQGYHDAYEQPPLAAEPYVAAPQYTEGQPYESGYQAYNTISDAPRFNEKIQPKAPVIPTNPMHKWLFICVLGLLLIGALVLHSTHLVTISLIFAVLAALFFASRQLSPRLYKNATVLPTKTFLIAEKARLIVRNEVGNIHIWRGEGQQVTVQATRYDRMSVQAYQRDPISYQQNGDNLFVSVARPGGITFFQHASTVLDIFVPDGSEVQLTNNAGSIEITGLHGRVNATTNAGSVRLTQVNLTQSSNITSNAGSIRVEQSTLDDNTNLSTNAGTFHIAQSTLHNTHVHTNAGTIHIDQGQIDGNNIFKTNMGTIYFSGNVGQQGTTQFKTDMGTIHVALPAQTNCTIRAKTNMGSVRNDFGSDSIGREPGAHLDLKSSMGSIHIERD
ncbi:hypothetical protein ccbrp13_68360 [Ktedonobacteria bacterium brp13]|nr:hypothetical protein ccbrp13_68360 [Ktedonobacteria bacterium brp13]